MDVHGCGLRVGVGRDFRRVRDLRDSYDDARRALRHATSDRPIVFANTDVRLFDELVSIQDEAALSLIPRPTREVLSDLALRETIECLLAADLNIARAAGLLFLHPNSVRYRLRRVRDLTGKDPRRLADLLELITAARLLAARASVAE